MKFKFTLIVVLTIWGMGTLGAQSQGWYNLFPILEQADTSVRDSFHLDLETLIDDYELQEIPWEELIDSLSNSNINSGDVIFNIPLYPNSTEWASGLDSLNSALGNANLESTDSTEIADQYQSVNDTWNGSLDSFNTVLPLPDDAINFNPDAVSEGNDRYEAMTGLRRQSIHILRRSARNNRSNPMGVGNLREALDTLFSTIFDLELAFGKENGTFHFYGRSYDPSATVIRVGSVPGFDKTWEARWSVRAAFQKKGEDQLGENSLPNQDQGVDPLRYGGNFSFMFNPGLGRLRAGGQFRLYTSLGMEVDIYAPANIYADIPRTFDNRGNTTGYGPQIGSGFIVNAGPATFYTYGTVTYGLIANCPGYNYRGQALHAGLHLGRAVNIQYEQGAANWAPQENKSFKYHRFTVGLLLSDLFR